MTNSNDKFWDDFNHHTPSAFWDVAVWPRGNRSYETGNLDVADRRRITVGVLEYLQAKIFAAIKDPDAALADDCTCLNTDSLGVVDLGCPVHGEGEQDEATT